MYRVSGKATPIAPKMHSASVQVQPTRSPAAIQEFAVVTDRKLLNNGGNAETPREIS
jgi:hypothetical protein